MGVMESVCCPADLRRLSDGQLAQLTQELREFLVAHVSRTGGHLGPNLGVVELTVAVHRVFDSPRTPVVFDTGHQSYVHKILTGRADGFDRLRTAGGLSGYPNRAESVHDLVENSHASTALSYADGLAKAFAAAGEHARAVVAVIGDGALTGGLAWEALNNLGPSSRRVVVVLNDNGRSYSPTVGGLPAHLDRVGDRAGYRELQLMLGRDPVDRGTQGLPDGQEPGSLFTTLGFGYVGPVDGHDLAELERALTRAREMSGPVVVHCRTRKGLGYPPAEADRADHMHTVPRIDAATGRPVTPPPATWTDAFAEALLDIGRVRRDVVAVTAAMLGPTGLQRFADRFPGRCHDVGIAEQHAIASAAGLAMGGQHPVVALYATFANRAFDQMLLDVGLHRLGVTLVLDRAGVTGPDGPSHHGMWDLAMLGMVPGIRVAAPRDQDTLVEELHEAVASAGPTVLRFPKAKLGAAVPAERRGGEVDVLREGSGAVLVVAAGPLAAEALSAAEALAGDGIDVTVADPRWVIPVSPELVAMAARHDLVVTVEDGVRSGGIGSRLVSSLSDAGHELPVRCLGLPTDYLPHGDRAAILARHGLDADGIAETVRASRMAAEHPRLALVSEASR